MTEQVISDTLEDLKNEIKRLQERCVISFNITENLPLDGEISSDNVGEKALNYVEGLREEIYNSNTPITTDETRIISEYLSESKQRLTQVQELKAFTRGEILDVEKEIKRLNGLTKTAQDALSRPIVAEQDVKPEHIQKAKEAFRTLKTELNDLFQSQFYNEHENITNIVGQLMQERFNEESSGYLKITQESYKYIELLRDMNIVCVNPYNNEEIKLAF